MGPGLPGGAPVAHQSRRALLGRIVRLWIAFVRGQLTLMLVVGVVTWLGMAALGVRGALLLGATAGVLEAVPNLGPVLAMLPAALVAKMDFTTLRLVPGTFVDEALAGQQSDVLFEVEIAGRPALVYVLLEHQSKPDRWMAFRLLRYLVRIWDAFRLADPRAKRLPPIVPIIVAHTAGGWRATTRFEDLVDLDGDLAELARHVPRFSYLVDDLTRASDRELLARTASAFARVVWVTLKHARGDLLGALHRVVALLREIDRAPNGPAVLGALLQYTLYVRHDPAETVRLGNEISAGAMAMATSAAEKLIQQGRREGRQEGRQEGRRGMLLRLLTRRFGPLPAATEERIERATPDQLDRWVDRIVDAPTLDEVLAE